MKKIINLFLISLFTISSFAQSNIPQLVSFSAIIKNANNQPIVNTNVSLRITFKQGGQNGALVYCAIHQNTTNQNGFVSIELNKNVLVTGCNGAPNNAFENIPWEDGEFWMEIEYQLNPGTPFIFIGEIELTSSFYAFVAGKAERLKGFDLSGANDGDVLTYNLATGQWQAMPLVVVGNNFSGDYNDLTNTPNLTTVATSGDYNDLINTPNIPAVPVNVSAFTNDAGYVTTLNDDDPTNELQQLSASSTGDTLYLQNAGFVIIPGLSYNNTPQLANVTTEPITNYTNIIATSGGNVTSNPIDVISQRGVCWNTSSAPTIANNFTNDGSGVGNFSSFLTGLTSNTTYYIRAYAINNVGIAYGNEIIFTTPDTGNASNYSQGTVFCSGTFTEVVEVINPITGKIWMDRNLGATQAATSSLDVASYGDLYQWGRRSDGHQCRNSNTTTMLGYSDQPPHGNFILTNSVMSPNWRSTNSINLWQGENGINNPCPIGYRLPTLLEIDNELLSFSSNDAQGAFNSPLKLPLAGFREYTHNALSGIGVSGKYWTSNPTPGHRSSVISFTNNTASIEESPRAYGHSVRCIKN